ncbi:ATP-binding cassette domain-containing protein [Candidatus Bathyarchaeota archaeon]|nr:ATP-binding cassette domain-containing protein [Candidatus Bathyarchaeota archaeon]
MAEILSVDIEKISYLTRQGEITAVKEAKFKVNRGEYLLIMGEVGSGKTSLLYSLNGVIPELIPNSRLTGDIKYMGKSIRGREVADISKDIGLVLEDPDTQITQLTVEDDLAFGPANMGLPPEEVRERVEFIVNRIRLSGLKERNPRSLSGGQKQCVAIGGVLTFLPNIVILDEPISMLDPIGKDQVLSLLKELNKKYGITIILSESGMEIESFAGYVDKILIMKDGELVKMGPPHEILTDSEMMRKCGLRMPQVTELAVRLGGKGLDLPITLEEAEKYFNQKLKRESIRPVQRKVVQIIQKEKKPIIKVKNLYYTYPGLEKGIEALRGVSFNIYEGEIAALIGQNGSGKSTLALLLVGILKPTNKDAEIIVDGIDLQKKYQFKELIKHINYVYQNPDDQIFCEKVKEELAYGLLEQGLTPKEIDERVEEGLKIFNLKEMEDMYISHLDRGRRTHVAISSIMIIDPKILIIDEPTTGLDERDSLAVMEKVKELKERGKTIIFITHNMNLVAKYADHVIALHEGKVLLDGTCKEVFSQSEILKQSYIAPPQITQLAQKLIHFNIPPDITTVDEMYHFLIQHEV